MLSTESPRWAMHPELVAFYTRHRNHVEDLYPSERRFLPRLARQARSVLDVGCAAGGFRDVWRQYQPALEYTGVDISFSLVTAARKLHPDARFLHADCASGLPLGDEYADVVQALGWLHWERRYAEALRELWRLTGRFLFFDVRLAGAEGAVAGQQKLAFEEPWDGRTTTPYVCVAWRDFARMLLELQPVTLYGFGYFGRPAPTVIGVEGEVCFAAFVLEKALPGRRIISPEVCVEIPLGWPAELRDRVSLVAPQELDRLLSIAD